MARLLIYQPGSHGLQLSKALSCHEKMQSMIFEEPFQIEWAPVPEDALLVLDIDDKRPVDVIRLINDKRITSVIFLHRDNYLRSYVENLVDISEEVEFLDQEECSGWVDDQKITNGIYINHLKAYGKMFTLVEYEEVFGKNLSPDDKYWKIREIYSLVPLAIGQVDESRIKKLLEELPEYNFNSITNLSTIEATLGEKSNGIINTNQSFQ